MTEAYCTVADVKEILRIAADNALSDVEIERCITSADRYLRIEAEAAGLTIPDAVPEAVEEASKHLAAWFFRRRADPPSQDQALFDLGMGFFEKWVGSQGPYVGLA